MKDFIFSAKRRLQNGKHVWSPLLHHINGKNLLWRKGFITEDEAKNYLRFYIERIKADYF